MAKSNRYFPEVRERAVRMVFEHEKDRRSRGATIVSISDKIGCTPETLRSWVLRVECTATIRMRDVRQSR